MATNSSFALVEIHVGFNNTRPILPWQLLERYLTSEGFRTRIVGHSFQTKEEALKWAKDFFDINLND